MQNGIRNHNKANCARVDYAAQRLAIRAVRDPEISDAMRVRIADLAEQLRSDDPELFRTAIFGADVAKGCGQGPAIIFGDSSEIPLLSREDGRWLEYRMGYLADAGDLMIVSGRRNPSFEAYQKKINGLKTMDYVALGTPIVRSAPGYCLRDKATFEKLCAFVSKNGGATIISYLTTSATWALASRLANETQYPVSVAGPPGVLSDCANNKLWFAKVVEELLGAGAMPVKRTAHGAATLVRHVMELAHKWSKLVLKVPNSAGSAGNYIVHTDDITGMGAKAVDVYVRARLKHLGWPGRFPLAVEVWDTNVLTSPSAQLWIPHVADGDPIIEGVFEQVLVGDVGTFAGAVPADLPQPVDDALCAQAFKLALLFQRLGYYGRCSFDAVLSGAEVSKPAIHWIECNARWGGVSIPMSFAKRADIEANYAIVQARGFENPPRRFEDALIEFENVALSQDRQRGIVFLNPNGIEAGTGCQFLAVEETQSKAISLSQDILERLKRTSGGGLQG